MSSQCPHAQGDLHSGVEESTDLQHLTCALYMDSPSDSRFSAAHHGFSGGQGTCRVVQHSVTESRSRSMLESLAQLRRGQSASCWLICLWASRAEPREHKLQRLKPWNSPKAINAVTCHDCNQRDGPAAACESGL